MFERVEVPRERQRPTWLAAKPVDQRAALVLALQRTAGNQAVARMLDSSGGGGGSETGAHVDAGSATPEERLQEIPKALASGETAYLTALWEGFGNVPAAAKEHEALFLQSAERAPSLWSHFKDDQDAFKHAVEAKAVSHLQANRDYVAAEMERLGILEGATPDADAIKQTQAMAKLAHDVLEVQERLRAIVVAYLPPQDDEGFAPMPMTFDPKRPAPGDPGDKTWDEVHVQWVVTEKLLGDLQAASPGVFATVQGGGAGAAGDLADADTRSAANYLEASLSRLMKSLEDTAAGVGKEYTWEQLSLLHPQVLGEPPFTEALAGGAARHVQGDHPVADAVMAAGMLAAVLGLFATGGLGAALAIVGAAAGGMQAGMSIAEYEKLAALRQARTGDKRHDLASADAVDEARGQAILDTLFAFLDAAAGAHAVHALGGAERVEEDLIRFHELEHARKADVLAAAMETMGEAPALERVGGIAVVRAEVAGSSGARRAEALAKHIEAGLGAELGAREAREAAARELAGLPRPAAQPRALTPEELIQKAREYVAGRTGLAPERALEVVAPHLADGEALMELAERAARTAAEWSFQYEQLATAEERIAFVHRNACEFARGRNLPIPDMEIGDRFHFNQEKWSIMYNADDFRAPRASNAIWSELRGLGIHELEHSEQFVEMGRYMLGEGRSMADIVDVTRMHGKGAEEIQRLGPLKPGMHGYEDAKSWYDSMLGSGRPHRDAVLARMDAFKELTAAQKRAHEALKSAQDALITMNADGLSAQEKAARRAAASTAAQDAARIDAVVERRLPEIEANRQQYLNLPEEKAAYRMQADYEESMAMRRETEAMKRAEAEMRGMLRADPPVAVPASGGASWDIHDSGAIWE